MTETLSFRRSVASLSHIRLRVTQSGGVHDKLPVVGSRYTFPVQTGAVVEYFTPGTSPGIASDNRLILRLEE